MGRRAGRWRVSSQPLPRARTRRRRYRKKLSCSAPSTNRTVADAIAARRLRGRRRCWRLRKIRRTCSPCPRSRCSQASNKAVLPLPCFPTIAPLRPCRCQLSSNCSHERPDHSGRKGSSLSRREMRKGLSLAFTSLLLPPPPLARRSAGFGHLRENELLGSRTHNDFLPHQAFVVLVHQFQGPLHRHQLA